MKTNTGLQVNVTNRLQNYKLRALRPTTLKTSIRVMVKQALQLIIVPVRPTPTDAEIEADLEPAFKKLLRY